MIVLITGGSGLLGKYLLKELSQYKDVKAYAPSSSELNVDNYGDFTRLITTLHPDIIIHCAAVAKYKEVEKDLPKAISTNIIGTCNATKSCMKYDVRLVYISTDHIFDGQRGNYKVGDKINPLSNYAKAKAAGELAVRMYTNSLSIRTSFCPPEFIFETAFTDKFTSQDYVDIIAPKIVEKSLSNETGVCHVGTERKSFYELAQKRKPGVKKGSVQEIIKTSPVPILIDTSFSYE